MNYALTCHLPIEMAHLSLPACIPFSLRQEGAFMAMPGALTICRGLNLNIQEMAQMLPTGLVCLICFFFLGVVGDGWFGFKTVGCNGSHLVPEVDLHLVERGL